MTSRASPSYIISGSWEEVAYHEMIYLCIIKQWFDQYYSMHAHCQVWHAGLTFGENDLPEQIQKRAIRIMYPDSRYIDVLESAHMELLSVRHENLSKYFFRNMCKPDSKLNYLLEKRNLPKYHCPIPETERYKGSFVVHNLLQLM